ncbi:MAG: hypothetical protein AAGK21_10580, partial [Bacteroidota bacterium]
MTHAATAFLGRLIDYAGLFPPASLDLQPALDNFHRYRGGSESWMLGPFIVPVGRLGEVSRHTAGASGEDAPFSVILPAGDGWFTDVTAGSEEAFAWEAATEGVRVDAFETRLPAPLASAPDRLAQGLFEWAIKIDERGPEARVALEVPYLSHPETPAATAQAIADANGRSGRDVFLLKLRCGGVTPDLVPSVEALASAITSARQGGVPFKATAGLHHPFPNDDGTVGTRMHGFVSVFGGAALALRHGLGADDLAEILHDADPSSWSLDTDLRWRSLSAPAADIAEARQRVALSFGSCSFDEPRDDLR